MSKAKTMRINKEKGKKSYNMLKETNVLQRKWRRKMFISYLKLFKDFNELKEWKLKDQN